MNRFVFLSSRRCALPPGAVRWVARRVRQPYAMYILRRKLPKAARWSPAPAMPPAHEPGLHGLPGREGLSRGGTGSAFRASQSAGTRNFETMSACGTCIGRPRIEPHCRPQDQRSMVVLPCRRIASDSVRLSPVSEFFPQQTWKFTDYLYMAIRFGILHDIRT